jgi:hypothetical protein
MSGWRKRQIDQAKNSQELYKISWTQPYDMTSLAELMEEILLDDEYKEANQIIERIKSQL